MRSPRLATIGALFLLVSGHTQAGVIQTDPQKLVTFSVPDGWAERTRSGDGIRFGRASAPQEPNVIAVTAAPRDPKRSIETQRSISRAQIEQQGARLVTDKTQEINGWKVWESVMETAGGASQIMHTFYFFSANVQAEVRLIARKADYPKYQEDLLAVVKSLREQKN